MASHKQRKEKKKARKHKRRNRERSAAKRRQKRNDNKEEYNLDQSTRSTGLRDVSNLIDNPREMIRQIFSSVGQEFLVNEVPRILKATGEELKKICLEELRKMSKEVIIKIIEGMATDNQTDISALPIGNEMKPSEELHRQAFGELSCAVRRGSEESQELILNLNVDEGDIGIEECAGGSNDRVSSCSEESRSENQVISCSSKGKGLSTEKKAVIKLAKVAPFSVRVNTVGDLNSPSVSSIGTSASNNGGGDAETYDLVDLGLDLDFDPPVVGMLPPGNYISENERPVISEEEVLQNMSDVRELEHRARAIRSMLANLDRMQT